MILGQKIKKMRELRNYTQEYVADELGLNQSAYSRIEKGETKITIERLAQIATVLDIDVDDILSFDDSVVFNTSNQNGTMGYIVNVVSETERKLYEDQIISLKEEIEHLKKVIEKLLK